MILPIQPRGGSTPTRAMIGDAGLDVYSGICCEFFPGDVKTIPLGWATALPVGHVGLLLGRSSMNAKGLAVLPGVIDSGFRGELCCVLANVSKERREILAGERIAQLVIVPCAMPDVGLVDHLPPSERGMEGFGSTGR